MMHGQKNIKYIVVV